MVLKRKECQSCDWEQRQLMLDHLGNEQTPCFLSRPATGQDIGSRQDSGLGGDVQSER